jgi:hypothetical protein
MGAAQGATVITASKWGSSSKVAPQGLEENPSIRKKKSVRHGRAALALRAGRWRSMRRVKAAWEPHGDHT